MNFSLAFRALVVYSGGALAFRALVVYSGGACWRQDMTLQSDNPISPGSSFGWRHALRQAAMGRGIFI